MGKNRLVLLVVSNACKILLRVAIKLLWLTECPFTWLCLSYWWNFKKLEREILTKIPKTQMVLKATLNSPGALCGP